MAKNTSILILALESSADETSAAVLQGEARTKKFKLLSNIIYSQIREHRKTGGIVPEVAARTHLPKILPAIRLALRKSSTKLSDIHCLAVTAGPGLVTSLMIGVDTAKALAFALQKPIIPINHIEGHLLSAYPPSISPSGRGRKRGGGFFPALGLTVSGGHTMLVLIKDIGRYHILGETLDDAAGEAFDKIAKILGLPYPGGPAIAKLADKGNPQAFDFPRPMLQHKNYQFSFAGLKTSVLYFYAEQKPKTDKLKADIAASVQQAIIDVLVTKTVRAAKEYKVKTILLGGGVAANEHLRKTLKSRIRTDLPATSYHLTPPSLTTDNAGMIAAAAFWHYAYGDVTNFARIKVNPNLGLKSWR